MRLKNIFVINLLIGLVIKVAVLGWFLSLPNISPGVVAVDLWDVFPPLLTGTLLVLFSAAALMVEDKHRQMLLRCDAVILLVASLSVLVVLLILPLNGAALDFFWAWMLCGAAALIGYSAYVMYRAFSRRAPQVQKSREEPRS